MPVIKVTDIADGKLQSSDFEAQEAFLKPCGACTLPACHIGDRRESMSEDRDGEDTLPDDVV